MHRSYPADEKTGAWFYYAKGSGIWFNLGRTIAFETHAEGYKFFNGSTPSKVSPCRARIHMHTDRPTDR